MVINFLGDSITEGAGAGSPENMYVNLVGQKLGAAVNNYGVGGTRIARQTTPTDPPRADEDFLIRAAKMDKNADFVFVFGGTRVNSATKRHIPFTGLRRCSANTCSEFTGKTGSVLFCPCIALARTAFTATAEKNSLPRRLRNT